MEAAWIPSSASREVFRTISNTSGSFFPTRDQLTLPGVSAGSLKGDPVRDAVSKYQGDAEASKRQVLGCDGVTADTRGLHRLIASGNYRSAVNMTLQLLELYGQGQGQAGHVSKHSHTSAMGLARKYLQISQQTRNLRLISSSSNHVLTHPCPLVSQRPPVYVSVRTNTQHRVVLLPEYPDMHQENNVALKSYKAGRINKCNVILVSTFSS